MPIDLPPPPRIRSYVLPEEGHVLLARDFASQELRVLAHYEDDEIKHAFNENPDLDLHQKVADDLKIPRQSAKIVNFAILYGVGSRALAGFLGVSEEEGARVKAAYFARYPSVLDLVRDLKYQARHNLPVRTWGGREYFCEKKDGKDFSYRLLNYLIQGSSADLTKQTMIEFHASRKAAHLLVSVHDELLVSAPSESYQETMNALRRIMSSDWLDVPLTSTGKLGPTWAEMNER